MANLNRVLLIGNLTRDPELRYIPSGTAVTTLGLAINSPYKTPEGERKDDVCFVRVVVWGKQAENCAQYLQKGQPVFIEGRLIYRSWEKDGQTRNTLEVRADRVQFLGRPKDRAGESHEAAALADDVQTAPASQTASTSSAGDDEPPF
jgi:single-strand DNA-binding protein